MINLYKKHQEVILYLIVGILATIVNIASYIAATRAFQIDYIAATALAWIIAVIFAFFTNKVFVFKSKTNTYFELAREGITFIGFRILSGLAEIVLMYGLVDHLKTNDMFAKVFTNIIVVILNYIFSKLFIFKS